MEGHRAPCGSLVQSGMVVRNAKGSSIYHLLNTYHMLGVVLSAVMDSTTYDISQLLGRRKCLSLCIQSFFTAS